jgi:hypothetical protein
MSDPMEASVPAKDGPFERLVRAVRNAGRCLFKVLAQR